GPQLVVARSGAGVYDRRMRSALAIAVMLASTTRAHAEAAPPRKAAQQQAAPQTQAPPPARNSGPGPTPAKKPPAKKLPAPAKAVTPPPAGTDPYAEQLTGCFEAAAPAHPVSLVVELAFDGKALRSRVAKARQSTPQIDACVARVFDAMPLR